MACNTLFGAGGSLIGPPDPKKQFTLSQAEIAVRDNQAFQLFLDFEIINGMAKASKRRTELSPLDSAPSTTNWTKLDHGHSVKKNYT